MCASFGILSLAFSLLTYTYQPFTKHDVLHLEIVKYYILVERLWFDCNIYNVDCQNHSTSCLSWYSSLKSYLLCWFYTFFTWFFIIFPPLEFRDFSWSKCISSCTLFCGGNDRAVTLLYRSHFNIWVCHVSI